MLTIVLLTISNVFMTINPPNSSVPDNGLCGTIPNNDPQ